MKKKRTVTKIGLRLRGDLECASAERPWKSQEVIDFWGMLERAAQISQNGGYFFERGIFVFFQRELNATGPNGFPGTSKRPEAR